MENGSHVERIGKKTRVETEEVESRPYPFMKIKNLYVNEIPTNQTSNIDKIALSPLTNTNN